MAQIEEQDTDRPLTPKYEKVPRSGGHQKMRSGEESNALNNWQTQIAERRKQQGYLSSMLMLLALIFFGWGGGRNQNNCSNGKM